MSKKKTQTQKSAGRKSKAASKSTKSPQKKSRTSQLKITLPEGQILRVPEKTTIRDVFDMAELKTPFPIVSSFFENKVEPLYRELDSSGSLTPIHLGMSDGALIARRTLCFILTVSVYETFPDTCVYINHSIDGGYYCDLYMTTEAGHNPVNLSSIDLQRIEQKMREIIAEDIPLKREEHSIKNAMKLFKKQNKHDKVELLKYTDSETVSVYQLKSRYNHFYGQLSPSTGAVVEFEIVPRDNGFVLRFARSSNPYDIPASQPSQKIFSVLKEYEEWMKILKWRTLPQFNKLAAEGRVREYVLIAEALHEKKLGQLADQITHHVRKPKIVVLAGPSASGKTTSVKRLAIQLRVNGKNPVIIGLDDFFVDRDKTPKDEFGEYDFESFRTVDIEHLQKCVMKLLQGEKVRLPKFDFIQGKGVPGHEVQMQENSILVIEGIHALNDQLLPTIPDGLIFKIYASPLTHMNLDDHNRISSSDSRLLRRIVRDNQFRGYNAFDTIKRWPSVRRGEEKNIFPYQENADVIFNSSLPYEISALKHYAVPVIKKVSRKLPEYKEASRLLKFLTYFADLDPDLVPRHSLLREFIGGSCFDY